MDSQHPAADRRTVLRMIAGGAALLAVGASLGLPGTAVAAPAVPTGSGRKYHVSPNSDGDDANDGLSPGSPFRTVQRAVDLAEPGDTVYLMNGVHRNRPDNRTAEQRKADKDANRDDPAGFANVCRITRSGTADAWIHLTAYPGHRPEIRVDTTAWNAVLVAGASYVLISGLTVTGNNKEAGYGYRDAFDNQSRSVPKNNCNGITLRVNFETRQTPHHVIVRDCVVSRWPGGGITSADSDYTTIENNTIHSNAWFSVFANSGTTIIRPRNSDNQPGYHNFIRNNYVWNNRGYIPWDKGNGEPKELSDGNGIIVDTTTEQAEKTGIPYVGLTLVCNNVSVFNGGTGVHAFQCENVHIINNTAYLNAQNDGLAATNYAGIGAWYCTDSVVANNISYLRPGKAATKNTNNVDVTYTNNCYFGGLDPVAGTSGPTDLVGVDPLLTDPKPGLGELARHFGLQPSSPCIGAGTAEYAQAVGADFAGRPRSAPIDLGALRAT